MRAVAVYVVLFISASNVMTATLMTQIENIGISQKLEIVLLDCVKLFPIFNPIQPCAILVTYTKFVLH